MSQSTDSVKDIKEILINEVRLNTPISKQNRNVYVIDRATIEKMPARSLQEVLQYANGVDLRQRGPFGTQADISIDGGSFEQTVVLLNGTKIIDAQTAHNMLNLPIPIELIERIEVVRGPAARIYGINSLTGAVNIVTKKPQNSGWLINTFAGTNFEKQEEGGNHTYFGKGIQAGGTFHKKLHQHSLFASHDKGNGYRFNTDFENNRLFYQGNVSVNSSNAIEAVAGYVKNNFGANGFYAAPGDKNAVEVVQTTFASVQSKHQLSERLFVTPRVSYRYNYDDYRYFGNANLNSGRSQHYANTFVAELNGSLELGVGDIGFGMEFRTENINSSNIGEHNRENMGAFIQYRTTFWDVLNVNAGTYVNYNTDFKGQIYPGIDASYTLTDNWRITGSLGTSQRVPSFTDLYLNQRPGNIGNPDLEAEDAFQGELGMKFDKGNIQFNAHGFYRKITNFIDWTRISISEPFQANNYGTLATRGFNVRADYNVAISEKNSFRTNLAYSFLDSKFSDLESDVSSRYQIGSLKHQITNTLDFQFKSTSFFLATRFNERVTGQSYWVNDFRASQIIKKFTVYIDVQNFFNSTYTEIGAIPLQSRWCSLGIKYINY